MDCHLANCYICRSGIVFDCLQGLLVVVVVVVVVVVIIIIIVVVVIVIGVVAVSYL